MMYEKHDKEFIESVKEELYIQTFKTDEPDFSVEKVDTLVRFLELEDPTDEQEIEEEMNQFLTQFKKDHRKEIWRGKIKRYAKEAARNAAVILLLIFAANLTLQVVANENLFRMVGRWANYIEIIPGKSKIEEELASIDEYEVKEFTTMEEFANYFADDFLFCSWLPEGVELEKIRVLGENDSPAIIWRFHNQEDGETEILVRIYHEVGKDTAGFTAALDDDSVQKEAVHDKDVTYYVHDNGYLAGFMYNDCWYVVEAYNDEDTLKNVIRGMVRYEDAVE